VTGETRTGGGSGPGLVLLVVLAAGFLVGVVARAVLLPTPGLTGDLDQFVLWTQWIATVPLGRAYEQNISFPPVMVYVWSLLTAVEPAFRTAMDSSDAWIRTVMKIPASLADLALAAGVGYALRARPAWAVAAALGIVLHPAVIDISAWWGQYESLYVLPALGAYLLAVRGRSDLAVALLAVALMTKPQALPLVVPFAAWFLARDGWRGSVRLAAIGTAVVVLLWLPFLPHGGPLDYIRNLAEYQGDTFAILSLRAWNPWWLFQEAFAGGRFVLDSTPILGPITLRMVGLTLAGAGALVVFLAVLRSPTPRTLALGLAAVTLVAFSLLTTMHERYAYAAIVFLALLLPDRRVLAVWLVFGAAFTLNLLAAIPPTPAIGAALPVNGPLGIAGSIVLTGCTLAVVWLLRRSAERPAPIGQPVPDLPLEPLRSLPTNAARYQAR
jgi:Gpi18-like mannosyltransferase